MADQYKVFCFDGSVVVGKPLGKDNKTVQMTTIPNNKLVRNDEDEGEGDDENRFVRVSTTNREIKLPRHSWQQRLLSFVPDLLPFNLFRD